MLQSSIHHNTFSGTRKQRDDVTYQLEIDKFKH